MVRERESLGRGAPGTANDRGVERAKRDRPQQSQADVKGSSGGGTFRPSQTALGCRSGAWRSGHLPQNGLTDRATKKQSARDRNLCATSPPQLPPALLEVDQGNGVAALEQGRMAPWGRQQVLEPGCGVVSKPEDKTDPPGSRGLTSRRLWHCLGQEPFGAHAASGPTRPGRLASCDRKTKCSSKERTHQTLGKPRDYHGASPTRCISSVLCSWIATSRRTGSETK